MLAIRMQRTGRKGHAQFRVVVQESRLTPSSGRTVATLGSYNPHTKTAVLEKEKAAFYLKNGAQPSDRVVRLFQSEGVELPKWVKTEEGSKKREIRNPDKLRRNQPAEEVAPAAEAPAEESGETPEKPEAPEAEVPAEKTAETEAEA